MTTMEKEAPKCVICGQGHTRENALQLLPGGKQWTHKFCDDGTFYRLNSL